MPRHRSTSFANIHEPRDVLPATPVHCHWLGFHWTLPILSETEICGHLITNGLSFFPMEIFYSLYFSILCFSEELCSKMVAVCQFYHYT